MRAFYQEASVAIGISREGVVIDVNPAYARLFGYASPAEVKGRSVLDQIAPADRPAIVEKIRLRGRGDQIEPVYEVMGLRQDGTEVPFEIAVRLVQTDDGPFTLAFITDITERRAARARLHDALELSSNLISASSVGIVAYRASGPCVLANDAVGRMIGAPAEELLRLNFHQIESWRRSGLYDAATRVLESGRSERLEINIFTTFGRDLWLDCYVATFHSGGELHLLAMFVDVSERRRDEKQFQAVLEHAADALFITDLEGRFIEVNAAACRLLGWARGELVGKHIPDIIEPGDLACSPLQMDEVLAGLRARRERTFIRKDGSPVPVELSFGVAASGRQRFVVCAARDISERRRLDGLRDEFMSVAAHELKTPLTVIKAYVALLKEWAPEGGDPRQAAAFEVLGRQCNRLQRLVQDLLEVSRAQLGRVQLRRVEVDLGELVVRTATTMQATTKRHRLLVRADVHPRLLADQERLEQVLMNLLDNAIRYSPDGGEIRTTVTEQGGEAVISVEDHGLGIPADRQASIFERFFRAHTSRGYGGMGVGLNISKTIVELHGGRISFESREGVGSTFRVVLPLPAQVHGRS